MGVDGVKDESGTSCHDMYVSRRRDIVRYLGEDVIDVEDWIIDIQEHLTNTNYNRDNWSAFVLDHIGGVAKRELRSRALNKPSIKTNDIFSALRETFGIKLAEEELLESFYSRKQYAGESLLELSHSLCYMYDRMKMSCERDIILRNRFIGAVTDDNLKRELQRLNREQTLTFIELRARGIAYSNTQPDKYNASRGISRVDISHDEKQVLASEKERKLLFDRIDVQDKRIDKLTGLVEKLLDPSSSMDVNFYRQHNHSRSTRVPQHRADRRLGENCWECGELGHIARYCSKTRQGNE